MERGEDEAMGNPGCVFVVLRVEKRCAVQLRSQVLRWCAKRRQARVSLATVASDAFPLTPDEINPACTALLKEPSPLKSNEEQPSNP